jgi:tetraacyldisaccharide 4'-kinase
MTLPLLLRLLLWPLSLFYGVASQWRASLYARGILKQKELNRPVISVGNLTVGGTGKTPMVIYLAEHFLSHGQRVGILSRGYKGSNGTSDEIELMKFRLQDRAKFGVGSNRYDQGKRLESEVDVFILDDGFQHLQLARDLNILLIDSSQPVAKQSMLPTGRLREPVSAMTRADLLIFTRAETVAGTQAAVQKFEDDSVFSAATRLLGFRRFGSQGDHLLSHDEIEGPFFAFCAIGNPRAFLQDLKNWNVPVIDHSEFQDHHRYDARDLRELQSAAQSAGAKALLTTEKDAQNLAGLSFPGLPLYLVVISLQIANEPSFLTLLHDRIPLEKHVA